MRLRDYIIFSILIGLLKLTILPYGATNSVAQFIRVIICLLYNLIGVVCQVFLNNIGVKGPTTTYGNKEISGFSGIRRFIAKYIRNLN